MFTHSLNSQHKQTLSPTSEKMDKEVDNRHATDETEKLIEKALAQHGTIIFTQFNDILT